MEDSADLEEDSDAPEDEAADASQDSTFHAVALPEPEPKRARLGKTTNTTSASIFGVADDDSAERRNHGDEAYEPDAAFVSESDDDAQSDAEDDYVPDHVVMDMEAEPQPFPVLLPSVQDVPKARRRKRKSKSMSKSVKPESKTIKGPGGRPPLGTDEQKIQEWTTDPVTKAPLSQQEMMYTRFHSSEELNFLKKHGRVTFTQGPFTKQEEAAIISTIVAIGVRRRKPVGEVSPGMSDWSPQLLELLRSFLMHPRRHMITIVEITKALCNRPIQSVFHHLKHVNNRQQSRCAYPWTPDEDQALRDMAHKYKDRKDRWQDIVETPGVLEGRSAQSLKDRWRERILPEERNEDFVKRTGKWAKEEEELLQSAVEAAEGNIQWPEVERLVGTRTARQCRKKWYVVCLLPFFSWEISDRSPRWTGAANRKMTTPSLRPQLKTWTAVRP